MSSEADWSFPAGWPLALALGLTIVAAVATGGRGRLRRAFGRGGFGACPVPCRGSGCFRVLDARSPMRWSDSWGCPDEGLRGFVECVFSCARWTYSQALTADNRS